MKNTVSLSDNSIESGFIICTQNLDYYYGRKKIIDSVSLDIKTNSITGFLGPNGCGKTTLLRLLAGFLHSPVGSVTLKRDLKMGFVFQTTEQNLIPWKNAIDNILLPFIKEPESVLSSKKEDAIKLIQEIDLDGIENKYPNELSGGQKQLVSLIRWLIFPTDLLFIDEGWSMLDIVQKERIHALIRKINQKNNTSIVLVSHSLIDIASLCHEVFLMSNSPGRIIESIVFKEGNTVKFNNELLWKSAIKVFPTIILG
jgi:NitT/TauT family transport system ATP-binding protein